MDVNVPRWVAVWGREMSVMLPDPESLPAGTTIRAEKGGRVERWSAVRCPVAVVGRPQGEVVWRNQWVSHVDLPPGESD